MTAQLVNPPRWITASIADATDTVPAELFELGAHVSRCQGCRDRWFQLRCMTDAVHDYVAGHFVTTLLIVGAAVGLIAAIL